MRQIPLFITTEMLNVKTLGMFKTKTQLLATADFASNLTAKISKCMSFFLVDFEEAFYEILSVWKFLFLFFVAVDYETFLQEQCRRQNKLKGSSCSGKTHKTTLRQFFLRC